MALKYPHYYGDTVRSLFLVSALIMVIGLPWMTKFLTISPTVSILGMLVLGIAGGFTNPKQNWTAYVNALVAVVAFFIFETSAVNSFIGYSATSKFFIFNQLLALIFLFAIYYAIKTIRGSLVENNRDSEETDNQRGNWYGS